jgi:succinate-acetate transporter protein
MRFVHIVVMPVLAGMQFGLGTHQVLTGAEPWRTAVTFGIAAFIAIVALQPRWEP